MSYTEVDICNRALSRLGCNTVSSPTGLVKDIVENSLEAKVCRSYYEQIRDSVLEARVWSFALHQDLLLPAPEASLPNGGDMVFETVKGVRGVQGWGVFARPDGEPAVADPLYVQPFGDAGIELRGETVFGGDGYFEYAAATQAVYRADAVGMRDYRLSFVRGEAEAAGKLSVAVVRGVFNEAAPPTTARGGSFELYALRGYDTDAPADPDAQAIFDAMVPPPTEGRRSVISATLDILKEGGVFDKLDSFQVYRAHAESAIVDWVAPSRVISNEGMVFTVDEEIKGGSGRYLRTGFIPSEGNHFALNDACLGVYVTTPRSAGGTNYIGGFGPTTNTVVHEGSSGANRFLSGQVSGTATGTDQRLVAGEPLHGFLHVQRVSASSIETHYNEETPAVSATATADTVSTFELFVGTSNSSGAPGSAMNAGFGAAWAGASLSAPQLAALREALTYYMSKVEDPGWEAG